MIEPSLLASLHVVVRLRSNSPIAAPKVYGHFAIPWLLPSIILLVTNLKLQRGVWGKGEIHRFAQQKKDDLGLGASMHQ